MATLLGEVIKDTIKEAALNKITLTPENYAQLFCKVAASKGVSSPECQKLQGYISRLNEHLQNEISKMPMRTESEFIAYLISRLNRASSESGGKITPDLISLNKSILNSIKLLRNKDATDLASRTMSTLENNPSDTNLKILREKWQSFIANYDDSYIDDLKKYGVNKSDDLKGIIDALMSSNIEISGSKDYYLIAELILNSLLPSITPKMDDELESLSKRLRDMPELIENANMQGDIKNLINKRIELDRNEFKSKILALDKILADIENELEAYSKKLGLEQDSKLRGIRKELEDLGGSSEYKNVKNKLENVANSISTNLRDFEVKLNDSKRAIKSLKDQIRELQVQLEKSAKEAQNDFLTGLYTKRALEAQLDRVEEDYINKDIEYCICFFDIDHFKHINDTYGQSAGNVILAKIGGILHKMSRQIDVVARYGGEEFVAILPLCDLKQAQKYANEILHNVHSYEFVYKQSKFNVTISCGIASRTQTKSRISCMEKADEMLYAAKKAGRNCVKVLES